MSDEGQDVELRVLVAQTLENNGVLSKIRAELRASVFLALEEQDGAVKTQILNKPFTEFVSSVEGSLILSLVRELLEFFELTYTLSVFDPETRCGKDYHYNGRNQLLRDLKMKNVNNGRKGPLLLEILRLARGTANDHDDVTPKTNRGADKTSSGRVDGLRNPAEERSPDRSSASNRANSAHSSAASNRSISAHTTDGTSVHRPDHPSSGRSSTTKSENLSRPPDDGNEDGKRVSSQPDGRSRDDSKARDDSSTLKQPSSTFPLLGNLPPLLNAGKTNDVEKARGKDLNVLDGELLGLGLGDSPHDNYDEDFHSSLSADDPAAKESDSEIEEDINSNHSVADDVVIDATLSNSSGVADYMEDVTNNLGSTLAKVNLNTK